MIGDGSLVRQAKKISAMDGLEAALRRGVSLRNSEVLGVDHNSYGLASTLDTKSKALRTKIDKGGFAVGFYSIEGDFALMNLRDDDIHPCVSCFALKDLSDDVYAQIVGFMANPKSLGNFESFLSDEMRVPIRNKFNLGNSFGADTMLYGITNNVSKREDSDLMAYISLRYEDFPFVEWPVVNPFKD